MVVVYIASPYSIGDHEVNVDRQLRTADQLMDLGYCPVVPLFTHYQHLKYPRPYEDWLQIDFEKIRRVDVLLRLEGESSGADREVAYARDIGVPVVYGVEELVGLKL